MLSEFSNCRTRKKIPVENSQKKKNPGREYSKKQKSRSRILKKKKSRSRIHKKKTRSRIHKKKIPVENSQKKNPGREFSKKKIPVEISCIVVEHLYNATTLHVNIKASKKFKMSGLNDDLIAFFSSLKTYVNLTTRAGLQEDPNMRELCVLSWRIIYRLYVHLLPLLILKLATRNLKVYLAG